MRHKPSVADVDAIAACDDAVVRNLRITQSYHDLSTAVAAAIGPGANWCTFATWASKQAGHSIRGDDLGRKLEAAFSDSQVVGSVSAFVRDVRRVIGRHVEADAVLRAIRDACAPALIVGRVANAVARGNKKVFEEIGREFAAFVDVGHDPAAVEAFCRHLRPGDPPDGQRLLAAAFRTYCRARGGTTAKARAEAMLLANLEVGLHEQTRLEPEIAAALNGCVPAPVALKARLMDALFPGSRGVIAGRLVRAVVDQVRARTRAVVTEELMTLALPGAVLRLGRDVTGSFPDSLVALTDPELRELLRSVDPTPDSPLGSGTEDWANLKDRMHFIADLFRTRHEDAALFEAPFTPDQERAIADQRVPAGAL